DLAARLASLRARAHRHPPGPTTDAWGQLSYRGASVLLSPGEHAMAQSLVAAFGAPVREVELMNLMWPDGDGTIAALRVHAHRLRRRIQTIGLTITTIRRYGYMMSDSG